MFTSRGMGPGTEYTSTITKQTYAVNEYVGVLSALTRATLRVAMEDQPGRPEYAIVLEIINLGARYGSLPKIEMTGDIGGEIAKIYSRATACRDAIVDCNDSFFLKHHDDWVWRIQNDPVDPGMTSGYVFSVASDQEVPYSCSAAYVDTAATRARRSAFFLRRIVEKFCSNNFDVYEDGIHAELRKGFTDSDIIEIEGSWLFVAWGGRKPRSEQEMNAFVAALKVNRDFARKIAEGTVGQPTIAPAGGVYR